MSAFCCGLLFAWAFDYALDGKCGWAICAAIGCLINAIAWYGAA